MKKDTLLKIPYPKLLLLLLSFYIARLILTDENNFYFHPFLYQLDYTATFLAGILFNFGFTFAPAMAALIVLAPTQNFWIAGIVATLGSMIGNYSIYRLVRVSFEDEINNLSNTRIFQLVIKQVNRHTPLWMRRYILPIFAGIIVATPLPDEFGVAVIAACHNISFPVFSVVSFVFSAFGVFIVLGIGNLIG